MKKRVNVLKSNYTLINLRCFKSNQRRLTVTSNVSHAWSYALFMLIQNNKSKKKLKSIKAKSRHISAFYALFKLVDAFYAFLAFDVK